MAIECATCGKSDSKLLKCGRCASRFYCATFATLHQVLQIAFGWATTHLYEFYVFDHSDARGRENRLAGGEPLFKITELSTDDDEFVMPGIPRPKKKDVTQIQLFNVLDDTKTKGKTIHYMYDFGDGWEHVVICVGRTDPTDHFVCLDGEGHGCAEDVGGDSGWVRLLEAYGTLQPTEEQKELRSWFEKIASNRDIGGLWEEKRWSWDKDGINSALMELNVSAPKTAKKSSVLLISLQKESWFDQMYSQVLSTLRSKATVTEVKNVKSTKKHLSNAQEEYGAIILTDAAILDDKLRLVQNTLVQHAKNGGTVILGFLFSNFCQWPDLNRFFKERWGLDWKSGNYHREDLSLNPRATANLNGRLKAPLLQTYSMKALHLSGANLEDRIYIARPSSDHSPAVFAKFGSGYVGWIGDFNTEDGTTKLLCSMCGV